MYILNECNEIDVQNMYLNIRLWFTKPVLFTYHMTKSWLFHCHHHVLTTVFVRSCCRVSVISVVGVFDVFVIVAVVNLAVAKTPRYCLNQLASCERRVDNPISSTLISVPISVQILIEPRTLSVLFVLV